MLHDRCAGEPNDRTSTSVISRGDGKAQFRADSVVPAQAGTQFVPHEPGFRLAPE
jgi:hypothetical protein